VTERILCLDTSVLILWDHFLDLPIEYVDDHVLRSRAWKMAQQWRLPTLYDAAFLACTELVPAARDAERQFWTSDRELLRSLGTPRPAYVRELGVDA
jgi:predicted nucleic acid-binding protein